MPTKHRNLQGGKGDSNPDSLDRVRFSTAELPRSKLRENASEIRDHDQAKKILWLGLGSVMVPTTVTAVV